MKFSEAIALGGLILCTSAFKLETDIQPRPSLNITSYIIFGQEALDPVPYIVSIQTKKGPRSRRWNHICGGSIISPNYILTAAHCVVLSPDLQEIGSRVVAGITNQRSRSGSRHNIVSFTVHPNFSVEYPNSDIAIVGIQPRFVFNGRTIAPIEFRSSQQVSAETFAIFHGWGNTEFGYPDKLQKTVFTTLEQEICIAKAYERLSPTDMCVLSPSYGFANPGDSGGPLVDENQAIQIGVCSYGSWNTQDTESIYALPTVFTRVSEFSDWIAYQISN